MSFRNLLQQSCQIKRMAYEGKTKQPTVVETGVPCNIQPDNQVPIPEGEASSYQKYKGYFPAVTDIRQGDIIETDDRSFVVDGVQDYSGVQRGAPEHKKARLSVND